MTKDIIWVIITCVIGFIVPGVLGYLMGVIKSYKKKLQDKKQEEMEILNEFKKLKESQMLDMKSELSNKFFVYNAMEEVEDYLVESFRKDCERYFDMGGDSWIHPMYDKSFEWEMKPTGYLK